MDIIRVEGGHRLSGGVRVSGAKNSALKLMAATLLAPGRTTLENVPNISDVHVMGKVLKRMGATIEVVDEHRLAIDTSAVDSWEAPYELVAKMRASTAVMGPLLGRFGRAKIAMPGGCNLGARKIDMHILGLEALGVKFDTDHGYIHADASEGLTGTTVTLEFASVGATENLIMAAVRAKGTTVIDNAAREPEIVDLACMLNEMGAKIVGAGSPVVQIEGVEELHPVTHRVIGDRIEAGTFIVAGALMAEDGGIEVTGFNAAHLGMVIKKFELMGVQIDHYVAMTMGAIPYLNDLIGGVEVTVLDDFSGIDDSLVEGETITLKGEQALHYVRNRAELEDSTNLNRMKRQQQYLMAAAQKIENLDENFTISPEQLAQIAKYILSDCSIDTLSRMSEQFGTYKLQELQDIQGEAVQGEEYIEYYVDEDALAEQVLELFYEEK